MCGIVGSIDFSKKLSSDETIGRIRSMLDTIQHRGPDNSGIWINEKNGVGLGHARLSIIDLSEHGHQPMISPSERYVIVFNGEIYNHVKLRKHLEDHAGPLSWKGHSDTEVMLMAFEHFGIEKSLALFQGMFAFAVLDRAENVLYLARDRIGEKPLYYGWVNSTFVFSSELHAIRTLSEFNHSINSEALHLYCRYGHVSAPFSIYHNINKLPAGCLTAISTTNHRVNQMPTVSRYWQPKKVFPQYSAENEPLHINSLEQTMCEVVSDQMVADVPIGIFLSGGIDSSLITALAQKVSTTSIKSFSIGFNDSQYNEAVHAKAVAKHIGTEHTELYVTERDTLSTVSRLASIYDEPFADSSQIPTVLLSALTRQHVTVSLCGDGGDELFGGYNRYLSRPIFDKFYFLPFWLRGLTVRGLQTLPTSFWKQFDTILFKKASILNFSEKMGKVLNILSQRRRENVYDSLISYWHPQDQVLHNPISNPEQLHFSQHWDNNISMEENMMYCDLMTCLPDDMLVKVDRASMAASLEVRAPFLDPRIIELAQSIPLHSKIRNQQTKWILREILYKHVPKHLIERPKQGFGVPLASWLRGPLKDWGASLIEDRKILEQGLFNSAVIQKKWQEHQSEKRNWAPQLWSILMFQDWFEHQQKK